MKQRKSWIDSELRKKKELGIVVRALQNIVDMPTEGKVEGGHQLSVPAAFPENEEESKPEDAGETLHAMPRQADMGTQPLNPDQLDENEALRKLVVYLNSHPSVFKTVTSCQGGHLISEMSKAKSPCHIGLIWENKPDEELCNKLTSSKYFNRRYDTDEKDGRKWTTFYYHGWMKNHWNDLVNQVIGKQAQTQQLDDYSCGPASLYAVLSSLGIEVPQEELKEQLGTNKDGTTPESMVAVLKQNGLSARVVKDAEIEELIDFARNNSVIVYYQDHGSDHYATVESADNEGLNLFDPMTDDIKFMEWGEFEDNWNGKFGDHLMIIIEEHTKHLGQKGEEDFTCPRCKSVNMLRSGLGVGDDDGSNENIKRCECGFVPLEHQEQWLKGLQKIAPTRYTEGVPPHVTLKAQELIRIYELEYKISKLTRRSDTTEIDPIIWKMVDELNILLDKGIDFLLFSYVMWITLSEDFYAEQADKYFSGKLRFFPTDEDRAKGIGWDHPSLSYMKWPPIILKSYKELLNAKSLPVKQKMGVFGQALNVAHGSGKIISTTEQTDIPVSLLDDLTTGKYIPKWDTELKKIAELGQYHSFWVAPDNKVIDAGDTGHTMYVQEHPRVFGLDYVILDNGDEWLDGTKFPDPPEDFIGAVLDKGWLRIGYGPKLIDIDTAKNDNHTLKRIQNFLASKPPSEQVCWGPHYYPYNGFMSAKTMLILDKHKIAMKKAELGQGLSQLTTERETGKTRLTSTEPSRWNESYHNTDQFEDADLKLGETESDDVDPVSTSVYPPYTDGIGQPNPRYEDASPKQRTITLHATEQKVKTARSSIYEWEPIDINRAITESEGREDYQDQSGEHSHRAQLAKSGEILQKLADDPVKNQKDYRGIKINIEWPKGSIRSYKGDDTYVTHMKCDYGYAKGIEGTDDDSLDIYLGDADSDIAYVLEQLKEDGSYDEDKLMVGFLSEEDAVDMYLQHMPGYMLGDIRPVPIETLVNALYGTPEDRREAAARGGWLVSANGEVVGVGGFGNHASFIWQNAERFNIDRSKYGLDVSDEIDHSVADNILRKVLNDGWIRLAYIDGAMGITSKTLSNANLYTLQNVIPQIAKPNFISWETLSPYSSYQFSLAELVTASNVSSIQKTNESGLDAMVDRYLRNTASDKESAYSDLAMAAMEAAQNNPAVAKLISQYVNINDRPLAVVDNLTRVLMADFDILAKFEKLVGKGIKETPAQFNYPGPENPDWSKSLFKHEPVKEIPGRWLEMEQRKQQRASKIAGDVFDPKINKKTKSDYTGPQTSQVGGPGGMAAESPKKPNLLFVYGTLREGEPYYDKYLKDSKYVRDIKTQPKYNLIVTQVAGLTTGESAVKGELYEVPDEIMAEIDAYEHPYYRQEIELEDGTKAYAYFVPEEVNDVVEEAPRMGDVESSVVWPGDKDDENLNTDPVESYDNRDIDRGRMT